MANRELVVLGTASQAPTRRRNHNGYFLRWDDEGLLFDPGEGTQRQMLFAGVTASQITRICITHFHGDHCLGLPGVLARMSLDRVPHPVEVCYPAGSREVFGRLRHAAFALADRADMLVCESTFANADAALARDYGHMTAGQAGQIAAQGGVRLLVLTHFSQRYEHGPDGDRRLADEAAAVFGGEVVLARDLDWIPVPPRRGPAAG